MRRVVILAVLVIVSAAAHAAHEWRVVFKRSGHVVYIDDASTKTSGGLISAWLRFEFPQEMPTDDDWPAYRSSVENRIFDCAARTAALRHRVVYSAPGAQGEALRGLTMKTAPMLPVQPHSIGAAVLDAVCGSRN